MENKMPKVGATYKFLADGDYKLLAIHEDFCILIHTSAIELKEPIHIREFWDYVEEELPEEAISKMETTEKFEMTQELGEKLDEWLAKKYSDELFIRKDWYQDFDRKAIVVTTVKEKIIPFEKVMEEIEDHKEEEKPIAREYLEPGYPVVMNEDGSISKVVSAVDKALENLRRELIIFEKAGEALMSGNLPNSLALHYQRLVEASRKVVNALENGPKNISIGDYRACRAGYEQGLKDALEEEKKLTDREESPEKQRENRGNLPSGKFVDDHTIPQTPVSSISEDTKEDLLDAALYGCKIRKIYVDKDGKIHSDRIDPKDFYKEPEDKPKSIWKDVSELPRRNAFIHVRIGEMYSVPAFYRPEGTYEKEKFECFETGLTLNKSSISGWCYPDDIIKCLESEKKARVELEGRVERIEKKREVELENLKAARIFIHGDPGVTLPNLEMAVELIIEVLTNKE